MKDVSNTKDKTWIQQEEETFIEGLKKYPDAMFRSAYTPPTDEDMRIIIDEMRKAPIYLKRMGADSYSDLQNAPAEELIEVAIANYKEKNMSVDFLVRLGFSLAQEGGWEHIAPAWLKAHREAKGVEFKGNPYIQQL